MEPNKFETSVREKLRNFQLSPSDNIWENVEKKVNKPGKDRRKVLFFLLGLVILTGAAYLLFFVQPGDLNELPLTLRKHSKPTNKPDSSFMKLPLNSTKIASRKNDTSGISSHVSIASDGSKAARTKNRFINPKTNFASQTIRNNGVAIKIEASNEKAITTFLKNQGAEIPADRPPLAKIPRSLQITKETIAPIKGMQLLPKTVASAGSSVNSVKPNLPALHENKRSKNDKQSKWSAGLSLSAGSSFLTSNLFTQQSQSLNYVSDPNSNGSTGGPSTGYSADKPSSSTGLSAGLFLQKKIAKRIRISAGASYDYFSFVSKVGAPLGLQLQYFSAFNTTHSFRNNFHFLELPVGVQFQLNRNLTFPVEWNAGISFMQMISTNALQFNNSGFYYQDNSVFNKSELGLRTGFKLTFFDNKKMPIFIGSQLYYSASALAPKGLYHKQHIAFIGIEAGFRFNRK